MAHYDTFGKQFVDQYYALFDDGAQRHKLSAFYDAEQSLMTFEGVQIQGVGKIMEKIGSLTFQRVAHIITAMPDCQPMDGGGILINVLGQLQTDDDPAKAFTQTFVLRPKDEDFPFFIQHDIFRLVLHNIAT